MASGRRKTRRATPDFTIERGSPHSGIKYRVRPPTVHKSGGETVTWENTLNHDVRLEFYPSTGRLFGTGGVLEYNIPSGGPPLTHTIIPSPDSATYPFGLIVRDGGAGTRAHAKSDGDVDV